MKVVNLAGYKDSNEGMFYFTPDGFKEACGGHGRQDIARLLKARGYLHAPDARHFSAQVTVPGVGRPRLYAVLGSIFEQDPCGQWATGPLEDHSQIGGGP